ncbi:MAG: hypothetical protein M3Y22_13870, partial [Pseudomonadota bacterium]|nr:hypothetical protein [Pseudomonadota bacterium]
MMNSWLLCTIALVVPAAAQQATDASVEECHLKVHAAIGCFGSDMELAAVNAADLYDRYGLNAAKINSPATSGFVHRFDCVVIKDPADGLTFRSILRVAEATESGRVVVRMIWA